MGVVYCSQTVEWIKMKLGMQVGLRMELGLGPGDFVLAGDLAPSPQGGGAKLPPNFPPISILAKRLDASRCHLVWT